MVTGNAPFIPLPLISEAVAAPDHFPGSVEGKTVEPGIDRGIAADHDTAQVNGPAWAVLHEMLKIVCLFGRGQARLVGHRR